MQSKDKFLAFKPHLKNCLILLENDRLLTLPIWLIGALPNKVSTSSFLPCPQQLRLMVEILWPLFLFLILMLVRLRGLRTYRHQGREIHQRAKMNRRENLEFKHFTLWWIPPSVLLRREGHALCRPRAIRHELHLHLQQHMPQGDQAGLHEQSVRLQRHIVRKESIT